MGLIGNNSKGFLILTAVVGVFLIFEFIAMDQIALGLRILIGPIILLSIVALEYLRNHLEFQCNRVQTQIHGYRSLIILHPKISGQRSPNSERLTILNVHNAAINLGVFLRDKRKPRFWRAFFEFCSSGEKPIT